ncbi:alanine dehydrogenase [Sulfurifustis variabilis]|uniref:Alanine dehydrogenase n=1 Tax=Sulfurifustis variabilis TaxID=1675686 RepID=A0A1B4V4T6_9GAMM|nr:alanine dehydrogenase [Sulfurifustis variabilis]BAU48553.1 alanine dehydrogenase [Sulfurifustis variabilis]
MRIGVPKEIKAKEGRVALVPPAAGEMVKAGHDVILQSGAGEGAGYPDEEYRRIGARIVPDARSLYGEAQMVLKVKEPLESEYPLLRPDHILFSYLHLAADPRLTQTLRDVGLTAVAFETVDVGGRLPLLAPMSDIAGRLAIHTGATLLHSHNGGRGVLLGGLASSERGRVVILGAGVAGGSAAAAAAQLGAQVTVFARHRDSLERMHALGANVTALPSWAEPVERAVLEADLLIGAVLVPGAKAPRLVTAEQVRRMKPGSVIIDISIDQGGCIETIRPTTYEEPTYIYEDVVHFGVTNMPGAVPRTASQALSTVLTPFVLRLASVGSAGVARDPLLASGLNVAGGRIVHPRVAESVA